MCMCNCLLDKLLITLIITTVESAISTNTSKLIFALNKTGASQSEQQHISHIFGMLLENCESHMLQAVQKPSLHIQAIHTN